MNLDEAIKLRIKELVVEKKTNLNSLCLISNITPSTIFDFINGHTKSPTIATIKKLCFGADISLKEFFDREYFNNAD